MGCDRSASLRASSPFGERGNATAGGVLARLASLAQIGKLARRLSKRRLPSSHNTLCLWDLISVNRQKTYQWPIQTFRLGGGGGGWSSRPLDKRGGRLQFGVKVRIPWIRHCLCWSISLHFELRDLVTINRFTLKMFVVGWETRGFFWSSSSLVKSTTHPP